MMIRVTIGLLLTAPVLLNQTAAVANAQTAPAMYACYVPLTGTVYRIKETNLKQTCTSPSHIEFSWNAQGPAGPPGQDGAQGIQGPPGAGISGWEMVQSPTVPLLPGQHQIGPVGCPAGKVPLGGGVLSSDPGAQISVTESGPYQIGTSSGWRTTVRSDHVSSLQLLFYAICANQG